MSLASAQLTGEGGCRRGCATPSGLGRICFADFVVNPIVRMVFGRADLYRNVAEVHKRIFDSSQLMAQAGIASRADVTRCSAIRNGIIARAANLIEELMVRELKPGIGFLRFCGAT